MSEGLVGLGGLVAAGALVSLPVGGLLLWRERWLARLDPRAQSRVVLAAALAPAVFAATVALAWVVDLAVLGCNEHRCMHQPLLTSAPVLAGAALLALRLAGGGLRATRAALHSHSLVRRLLADATPGPGGARVLPGTGPKAFVAGVLRPTVFVSRGLVDTANPDELAVILAHERAHALRRDPLRGLVARAGLALHLPFIASRLAGQLARTHELAADADAATTTGDPLRIAEVLLRHARASTHPPVLAAALSGGDLEARVESLVAQGCRPDRPKAGWIGLAAFALAAAATLGAHRIHALFENVILRVS